METIEAWIQVNSLLVYLALFGYCALKSGALPLLAAIFIEGGSLSLVPVLASSFLGGYLGDELRFHLSRCYGESLLHRFKSGARWLKTGQDLMERFGHAYIFIYRYPKGMRTIGAFPVGLGTMTWKTFTILNAASALLWSTILVGVGYFAGSAIQMVVENNFGWVSAVLLVPLGIFVVFQIRYIKKLTDA